MKKYMIILFCIVLTSCNSNEVSQSSLQVDDAILKNIDEENKEASVRDVENDGKTTIKYYYIERKILNKVIDNWDDYFPEVNSGATDDIINLSKKDVIDIFGMPNIEMRQIVIENNVMVSTKELIAYYPYNQSEDKEPTGFELEIIDDIVVNYVVDELTGYVPELIDMYFE